MNKCSSNARRLFRCSHLIRSYSWPSPMEVSAQNLTIPDGEGGYILTKTHCGGTCFGCPPQKYLQTQQQFQNSCLSGDYRKDGTTERTNYDPSIVSKAMHLIRDPFDNIVSRFHLKRNAMTHAGDMEWLAKYSNSREGFRDFCDFVNTRNWGKEEQLIII